MPSLALRYPQENAPHFNETVRPYWLQFRQVLERATELCPSNEVENWLSEFEEWQREEAEKVARYT